MITMNAEVEAEVQPEEVAPVTALTPLAAAVDAQISELFKIKASLTELEGEFKGKAAFKALAVSTRKELHPVAGKILDIWREINVFSLATVQAIPSNRKRKSPEDIKAEIAALEAKLDAYDA